MLIASSICVSSSLAAEPNWDLSVWKLTLPINTEREGDPDEVFPPELLTFSDPRFLTREATGSGVRFRAPCHGETTSGSSYPRTELREMQADGMTPASWGTADGDAHTLTTTLAITHLPEKKPHLICVQIHNEKHKLLAIRVEKDKLLAEGEGQKDLVFLRRYQLGTPLTLEVRTGDGRIRVRHNQQEVVNWESNSPGCYFKAGCYTQSNPKSGDSKDAYGEVVITDLQVVHQSAKTVR